MGIKHSRNIKTDLESIVKMAQGMPHNSELRHYSIFKGTEAKDLKIRELILEPPKETGSIQQTQSKDQTKLRRALGSLIGLAIADSFGHILEFEPLRYDKIFIEDFKPGYFLSSKLGNQFELKPGQWTDDTSMALCLADSLIENNGLNLLDLRKRFIMWYCFGYNNAFRFDEHRKSHTSIGLGGNIGESLMEFIENQGTTEKTVAGNKFTSGNGSIMRLAPVPIFYHNDINLAVDQAALQSLTTHQGLEAADCCRILSYIIVKAINCPLCWDEENLAKKFFDSLDIETELVPKLETETGKCLALSKKEENFEENIYNKEPDDRNWNWKSDDFKYSPTRAKLSPTYIGSYAVDGLAMALHHVYHTNSYKECILRVINLCGDADSVGAIAGQMVGALYGVNNIPNEPKEMMLDWDYNGEIGLRALKLFNHDLPHPKG